MVFAIHPVHVATSYLRNAEHHRAVDHRLPPHGGHGSSHGSAYHLAYSERLVHEREAMSVGVIILTYEHAAGLHPLAPWVVADKSATWHELLVLLSAE